MTWKRGMGNGMFGMGNGMRGRGGLRIGDGRTRWWRKWVSDSNG